MRNNKKGMFPETWFTPLKLILASIVILVVFIPFIELLMGRGQAIAGEITDSARENLISELTHTAEVLKNQDVYETQFPLTIKEKDKIYGTDKGLLCVEGEGFEAKCEPFRGYEFSPDSILIGEEKYITVSFRAEKKGDKIAVSFSKA